MKKSVIFGGFFIICYLAEPRPTLGHYRGNSIIDLRQTHAFVLYLTRRLSGALQRQSKCKRLTLPLPNLGRREKLTYICIFTLLCGTSKVFIKAFKAFIKPLKGPQKSAGIKLYVNFLSLSGIGAGRAKQLQ